MSRLREIFVRSADPFRRGVEHGSQVREEIRRVTCGYRESFRKKGYTWEEAQELALAFLPRLEQEWPDLAAEAKGIAQGAGVPLGEIMVLNSRYELLKFGKGEEAPGDAEPQDQECTLYALLPQASGETIVGQNWDNAPFIGEDLYILHIDEENGNRILALTEPGQLVRSGMNTSGVGIACATLLSTCDRRGTAFPTNFIRRRLLQCRSLEEARKLLAGLHPDLSLNYLVASGRDRDAFLAETNPMETYWISPQKGVIGHGNDFVGNPRIDRFRCGKEFEERQFRGQRLQYLLSRPAGSVTVDYLMECLADHYGYPASVCNHCPEENLSTIASTIYCLDRGAAYICKGNPCQNSYEEYRL